MDSVEALIQKLELQSHPEGGYFKETYRSEEFISTTCLPDIFDGKRNYSTGIYYLLKSEDFSAFHKVNQDEMWHFYLGDPITLSMISGEGVLTSIEVGNEILKNQIPQFVVPKNYWFAANVKKPNSFALVGCTVAPGFDFNDFELASCKELVEKFPQHSQIIKTLTRQ